MDSKLINVENKFAHDLIGTGEDLFYDRVVLSAKRQNTFKDVLATMITCLELRDEIENFFGFFFNSQLDFARCKHPRTGCTP